MIKIKFPSPVELSTEDWFEQMELTLFHAKKAFEKFSKSVSEENRKDISVYLSYPEMDRNKDYRKLLENEEIYFNDSQEVEINICY